jgi:hypothetical protein
MLSVRSSHRRRRHKSRPFVLSASNWDVGAATRGEKWAYGCVKNIRLVLCVWRKWSSIWVDEVVM